MTVDELIAAVTHADDSVEIRALILAFVAEWLFQNGRRTKETDKLIAAWREEMA